MRGNFQQVRSLVGVSKKLQSQGYFLLDKSKGILWITEKPFPQILKITASEIQMESNHQVLMKLSAKSEPVVQFINELLFTILSGDVSSIEKNFAFKGQSQGKSWTLQLIPLQPNLRRIVKQIQLEGTTTVNRITIDMDSGDATQIAFMGVQSVNALSDDDLAKFK